MADPARVVSSGSAFNLTSAQFSGSDLNQSIGYWSGCYGYNGYIPTLLVGGSGGIPVSVTRVTGTGTACGSNAVFRNSNGDVTSATITVYTQQGDGTSCSPLTDVIAHEIGHIYGLANAPSGADCRGHIMGERTSSNPTRSVYPDDCDIANAMWETPTETQPPDDPYCQAYGCSPILVDLDFNGFHLTGLDDPVAFDIDADGRLEVLSWTQAGEMDAFLVLDRNGNGSIDDGGELFGNVTRLADSSRAFNGYVALAELDSRQSGGNGDGGIDSADAAFSSLRTWTDLNHDGISQPEELQTLPEAGIERMEVDYKSSHRTDRYGNEFRFLGKAWKEGRHGVVRLVLTWDVFFLVAH